MGDSCSRSDTPASASRAPKKERRTDSREPEPLSSVLAPLSEMDLGVCRYRDDLRFAWFHVKLKASRYPVRAG